MNRAGRAVIAAAVAVVASALACTDLDPQAGSARTLEINTGLLTIQVGQTVQANAAARNTLGAAIEGVDISWNSSNPLVASISDAGLVTALTAGTTTVSAAALGLNASVVMTVIPQAPTPNAISIAT